MTIERADGEHHLLLHAEDAPELDVPLPVGLLRVDDPDVGPSAGTAASSSPVNGQVTVSTRVCAGRSPL